MKKDRKKQFKRNKTIKRYIAISILIVIVSISSFFIGKRVGLNTDTSKTNTNIEDVKVETQTIKKTLTSSGEIKSSNSENLSLSTSYYFDSLYVEEDDIVKKGEKILKYTNGTYLTAPYDLVITKISVPSVNTKASSNNYIQVENIEDLIVNIDINESEISNISLDQSVDITLTADTSKTYTGKISKISSVGNYSSSGSTFSVEVSIKNDGNIKIGMSVSCVINVEELKDIIAVPISAVYVNGDRRYVVVVDGDDTKEVDVTTGLSDDTYVEIKSGLSGGETIRVVTITKQNTIRSNSGDSKDNKRQGMNSGGAPSGDNFDRERPSTNRQGSGDSKPSK